MGTIEKVSRKIAVVIIYFLMLQGCFQIKNIFQNPSKGNLESILFSLILAMVIAYTNGFDLFRLRKKS
jgi:hypothetical protein